MIAVIVVVAVVAVFGGKSPPFLYPAHLPFAIGSSSIFHPEMGRKKRAGSREVAETTKKEKKKGKKKIRIKKEV